MLGYATVRLLGNIVSSISNPEKLDGAVWLYVVSQNNVDALNFLRTAWPHARLVAGQGKQIGRYNNHVNRLSLRRKVLYYGQLPGVWWQLRQSDGWAARRFFDLIFAAIGYYEVYRRALRNYRPRVVVFANDHNDDARAMLLACHAEGIPTAYVQHASVSRWFPPLSFDLSLLEGQHALDTYRACGPVASEVALVGMPKADAFLARRNTAAVVRKVAIVANLLDSTEGLVATLDTLLPALAELEFTFRAHPGDARNFQALLATRHPQLHFSDPRTETVLEFLQRHDALIAADTSTHLEATLLNLVSLYHQFGPSHDLINDYYGYVRHGLVDSCRTTDDLISRLREFAQTKPSSLHHRAAYFCATIGTPDEGHSEALALETFARWFGRND